MRCGPPDAEGRADREWRRLAAAAAAVVVVVNVGGRRVVKPAMVLVVFQLAAGNKARQGAHGVAEARPDRIAVAFAVLPHEHDQSAPVRGQQPAHDSDVHVDERAIFQDWVAALLRVDDPRHHAKVADEGHGKAGGQDAGKDDANGVVAKCSVPHRAQDQAVGPRSMMRAHMAEDSPVVRRLSSSPKLPGVYVLLPCPVDERGRRVLGAKGNHFAPCEE